MTVVGGRLHPRQWVSVVSSVLVISALHYETALHAVVLHEVFTRLYYLPIVFAALSGGTGAGLATAAMASVLYLPHVIMGWHAWPAVQVGQYAEQVVFVIIAVVSGRLGTRLREERNRAQETGLELAEALRQLRANLDERIQLDRLATTGQLATGMAHELRNPLAAAHGALDIIERGTLPQERRVEFFEIARGGIDRAATTIQDLLDFARPSPPSDVLVDVCQLVHQAWRLTAGALSAGGVVVEVETPEHPVLATVDVGQVQRALVALMLETPHASGARRIVVRVLDDPGHARVSLWLPGDGHRHDVVASLFEPFADARVGHGLTLALARRLVENQGGNLRTEDGGNGVLVLVSFRGLRADGHESGTAA